MTHSEPHSSRPAGLACAAGATKVVFANRPPSVLGTGGRDFASSFLTEAIIGRVTS